MCLKKLKMKKKQVSELYRDEKTGQIIYRNARTGKITHGTDWTGEWKDREKQNDNTSKRTENKTI